MGNPIVEQITTIEVEVVSKLAAKPLSKFVSAERQHAVSLECGPKILATLVSCRSETTRRLCDHSDIIL